ncbi:uncharacterized protein LOC144102272 [Amblyomma americanum]
MLHVRFSMEYLCNVKKKKLYVDLVGTMLPLPIYRLPHIAGPGADVLKRFKKMPILPAIKSFFFKLHTNTLSVKTWMHDKGIFVPWSTNCFLCHNPETIEHVFLDCWDPIFFWDVLQRTLKKDLPLDAYGIRFLPFHKTDYFPFDAVMLLGLNSLWKTRMEFNNADEQVKPVREHFIQNVVRFREA